MTLLSPPATEMLAPTLSLKERALADDVRFILALFVDMNGKPCAKLVPISAADELEAGELGFAGFAAGLVGQRPHDPDLIAVPDMDSYMPVPFIREGLAIVHCDPHVNGEPWPYAPRVILKNALAALAERGFTCKVGAEVEYFLLDRDDDGRLITADRRDGERACYDARGLTRMYEHLTAVSDAMNTLGWANYANDHEDASGQFEQNFAYADALVTADRVITLRYLINVMAEQRGMTATFMPKPFTDRTGSGLHLHLSLWQDGSPVFPDTEDARGLGLSGTAYSFVAGVLDHAAALQLFLAPSVNSYKRRGATTSASGATWSPRRASYGGNDRTHFIRVPDGNRVELRAGDGSANPYLAIATTLFAGIDGLDRRADPGDPCGPGEFREDSAELPRTLLHAVDALRDDDRLLSAVDGGRGVGAYFADAKEEEFLRWHNTVSDWEIDHYLTAY
ncbi:type III glutamate--ammonia ligase [Microbacterium sp. MEC084]|uniref:type III glutamate--ammonia ligase n=1 Tax=unclassified Microbacterium TaxID=2609290 RepID=UPI0006F65F89|nr:MULTISPECIES: type III glutamate--ammonia ligase [unclassified Microbacterium]KQZ03696.1 glutamate--ammonia ligase [Microbacterium sp. Root53]MCD1269905.1 type III glutamate--ammonia ligase [Microbacterium sp. MEC084]